MSKFSHILNDLNDLNNLFQLHTESNVVTEIYKHRKPYYKSMNNCPILSYKTSRASYNDTKN